MRLPTCMAVTMTGDLTRRRSACTISSNAAIWLYQRSVAKEGAKYTLESASPRLEDAPTSVTTDWRAVLPTSAHPAQHKRL